MKRLIRIAMLATLTAGSACHDEPEQASPLSVVAVEVSPLAPIQAKDSVVLTVTTINVSDQPVEYAASRSLTFDMVVRTPEQGFVWRLHDLPVGAPANSFRIEPGQSDTWTASWPLLDSQRNRVAAGAYSITGIIGDFHNPILETEPLTVGVAAPGGS